MRPQISLILPTYNGSEFIAETMASVLGQTFEDFEVLVMDDCSSDDTVDIVEGFHDSRVRVIRNAENLGIAGNMNKALKLVRAPYVARTDQDDISDPDRFAEQFAFLEAHPDIHVLGADCEVFGFWSYYAHMELDDSKIKSRLIDGRNIICNPVVMYRKELRDRAALSYNSAYYGADDYDFWVSCMESGARFSNLQKPLLRYRTHEKSVSQNNVGLYLRALDQIRRRALGLYFPDLTVRQICNLSRLRSGELAAVEALEAMAVSVEAAHRMGQANHGQDQALVLGLLTEAFGETLDQHRGAQALDPERAREICALCPAARPALMARLEAWS